MAERKRVRYSFESPEAYEEHFQGVEEIVKADTGEDELIYTRTFPPIGFSPPITIEAIDKLKGLEGVVVAELDED